MYSSFSDFSTEEQNTHLLDVIGFALNEENPDESMDRRTNYPLVMRCSAACSTNMHYSFEDILQVCIAPPHLSPAPSPRLGNSSDINQIIVQTGSDSFVTYVRERKGLNKWFEFDHFANDPSAMNNSIEESEIQFEIAIYC